MPACRERQGGVRWWGAVVDHHVEVTTTAGWVPRAADVFEFAIRGAVEGLGRCVMAISGGNTPAAVFGELAHRDLPWDRVVIVQVDERLAAIGSDQRNLTQQLQAFGDLPLRWLALPMAEPINDGIATFTEELHAVAGIPPILDVVHLGLGIDGHTASLVPGDPVLDVVDADVATTGMYRGHRRVTLTRPILDRARLIVWLVHGAPKAAVLGRLLEGDESIPAGLLRPQQSLVVADEAALPGRRADDSLPRAR